MEVRGYSPSMAGELAALYSEVVQGAPYCFPVTVEEFSRGLGLDSDAFASQAVLAALERGRPVGFAHPAVPARGEAGEGLVRGIIFRRDRRDVGAELAAAAEGFLRERGVKRVSCFPLDHGWTFYHFNYGYLTERLWHIYGLLGMSGYANEDSEIYMDWRSFEPAEPDLPPGVEFGVERLESRRARRPGVHVSLDGNGGRLAHCKAVAADEFTSEPSMERWAFIKRIDVLDESRRGEGLGRAVLLKAACALRELGFRHLSISANIRNYRAALFYASLGFDGVVSTFLMRKSLA